MKKVYLFAALSAMLTACSQTDELNTVSENKADGQKAVNFDIYTNRATTRGGVAQEITTTSLKSGDHQGAGFGVFGYYTDNGSYDQYAKPNFMYNQQVKYSTDKWTYEPVKYWPNEYGSTAQSDDVDRVSFFAYAPWVETVPTTGAIDIGSETDAAKIAQLQNYNITGMTTNSASGDPFIKYVVDWKPKTSVDLLWGVVADASDFSPIVGTASLTTGLPFKDLVKENYGKNVKFNLRHALAKLNIQIDAFVDGTDATNAVADNNKIFVRAITFEGFATKGALNLNNTTANTPLWMDYGCVDELAVDAFTIHDGRKDGKEGYLDGAASNEKMTGLNPVLVQSVLYSDASLSAGVTKTAVNLFDPAGTVGTAATAPIYVIPTNEELKITIVYDVETKDDNLAGYLADGVQNGSSIENKITQTVKVGTDNLKMEAGKAYTINLHLGMTSVKIDAAVEAWGTGGTANTDLPKN